MTLQEQLFDRVKLRVLARKLRSLGSWLENQDLQTRAITPGTSMLVIAPHQDDESIGCGGTIKLATSQGGRVDVLYMTDGRRGFQPGYAPTKAECEALAGRRRAEARAACETLGVSNVVFLDGEDSILHSQAHLWRDVLKQLDSYHYDIVLAPWPFDQHRDHQTTWRMTLTALEQFKWPIDVWLYEVWTPLVPNIAVDITTTVDAKREAVQKHVSQLVALDYVETSLGLSRYRSTLVAGAKHAEVFLGGDKPFALALWSTRRAFFG